MRGGGWGFTGAASIPGTPGTVSNPQVFTAIGDCRATEPGYWIPQSSYGTYQKGLPGMSGGKRTWSKRRRTNRKQRGGSMVTTGQRGGRYTFDLSPPSVAGVAPNAAAWWAGSYPPVQRIACEGSTPNPLNPGPHTPSTQPLPVASANLHLNPQSGGSMVTTGQRGGGNNPGTVGVGNVDSMYYYAPTAGYDNKPSTWVDSVGAPVQLQIPFAARELNPSCITTGHPPPLTGALQKGGSLWNTLKNSVKKATNAVGITKKNNSTVAAVGSVYNNVSTLNTNIAPHNIAPNNRLSNLGSAYNVVNQSGLRYPALPASPVSTLPPYPNNGSVNNLSSITSRNSFSNGNSFSNANSYISGYENSVGGKRKGRKGSKKSRKARKGRKH